MARNLYPGSPTARLSPCLPVVPFSEACLPAGPLRLISDQGIQRTARSFATLSKLTSRVHKRVPSVRRQDAIRCASVRPMPFGVEFFCLNHVAHLVELRHSDLE